MMLSKHVLRGSIAALMVVASAPFTRAQGGLEDWPNIWWNGPYTFFEQQSSFEIAHGILNSKPGANQGKTMFWRVGKPGLAWNWDPAAPSGVAHAGPVNGVTQRIYDDNLFCAGHCADENGNAVIGGGDLNYHLNPGTHTCTTPWNGCEIEPNWTYVYDSAAALPANPWVKKTDMLIFSTLQGCSTGISPTPCQNGHWYPGLVKTPGHILSAGGTTSPGVGTICPRNGAVCRSNESQVFNGTSWSPVGGSLAASGLVTGPLPAGKGPNTAGVNGLHVYPILHVLYSGWLFASAIENGGYDTTGLPIGQPGFNWSPSALMDISNGNPTTWSWQLQHYDNRFVNPTTMTTMNLHDNAGAIMPYVVYEVNGVPVVKSLWSWLHDPPASQVVDEILLLGGDDAQPTTVSSYTTNATDLVWRIREPHLSLTSWQSGGTSRQTWTQDLSGGVGLNYKRTYVNFVLLPDCTGVAIGGSANAFRPYKGCTGNPATDELDAIPEHHAEIIDFLQPGGNPTWQVSAIQKSPRLYHSIGLLQKDGRVVSMGGYKTTINGLASCSTLPFSQALQHTDAEVFIPAYLHQGLARPAITTAVTTVQYGQPMTLNVAVDDFPNPAEMIDFATLIRCGSATHHFDWDQRCIRLEITARPAHNQVTLARLPSVANRGKFLALPGMYMLFVVRKPAGNPLVRVPSIAQIVQVL